mmetsp:Transcript_45607/g.75815  ORF Transcript_45607/g.75815 Transcript_45607/m.75815 type:complete len:275 (-) Transcript_45607:112-936(-)
MQTREWHQVDAHLSQIAIQFTAEAQRRSNARHHHRNHPVQVGIFRLFLFQHIVRNAEQRLIVDDKRLVRVLQQLMDRQRSVVRLDHHVRHFRRRVHTERGSDTVRIIVADLQQQQRAHAGSGAAANTLCQLKALRTVTLFSFSAHNVHRFVDELRTFGVVSFRPIVARARRAKTHVVRLEERTHRRRLDHIHNARLQIHQTRARHETHSARLLIVHVDLVQTQLIVRLFRFALKLSIRLQLVLFAHRVPEGIANLVSALSNLDVNDLSYHIAAS